MEIFDNRFEVVKLCSDNGGMGLVLLVKDLTQQYEGTLALKYCRETSEEYISRFKREVRLVNNFKGNEKVVQILHSNFDHNPPYFVMPFYEQGDLLKLHESLSNNYANQEKIINQMIDCISELHRENIFHRDIKPQNFLINDSNIIVSDFGLGLEPNSISRFTVSSDSWGTHGFLPPEFQDNGFKYADAQADIFMLGKSIYALLTKIDPTYFRPHENVHSSLQYVLNKACAPDKDRRFKNLSEMKQAVELSFDVILKRRGVLGEAQESLEVLKNNIATEGKYSPEQVKQFVSQMLHLNDDDLFKMMEDISRPTFFKILSDPQLQDTLEDLLNLYEKFIEAQQYAWAFAETVAKIVHILISSPTVTISNKAKALDLAIKSAIYMNRYAAMETCSNIIKTIVDEDLAQSIVNIMRDNQGSFIDEIERSSCKSPTIRNYLEVISR